MSGSVNEISVCEVCGNTALSPVLNLGAHPMCDDLVAVGDVRVCREYPIDILFCEPCRTAHQKFQVPKQDLFPSKYHYRSRFTADVLKGMASLVVSCKTRFGDLTGKKVVDIGCNDGSLLDFFREQGAVTLGIEPTGAAQDAQAKGHIVFNSFLSEAVARCLEEKHGKPDFITFTNVFAHIENLGEIFASLRNLIKPSTVIVIENHYLGSVLDGNQFDTFYHEHPRTYSLTSFEHIANALGMRLLKAEFPARYGGNIRVFLGKTESLGTMGNTVSIPDVDESRFLEKFAEMAKAIKHWRSVKKQYIERHVKQHGALRAKAFPGRAAILVKLLGLNEQLISAVYEKPGSMKIGHYLPGTRIPILSDDELFSSDDLTAPILNLAWHIPQEIRAYLCEHGYQGDVMDVVHQDDFKMA